MKKGRVKVSEEQYKEMLARLLEWEWMAEAFDSTKNQSVCKLTKKGTDIYAIIIKAVGTDSLVNGYKLKLNEIYSTQVETYQGTSDESERYLRALQQGDIITRTFDYENNKENYELTPNGAKLFVTMFVANNRQVGTLPGDWVAKIMKGMAKMPEYSIKFSEFMDNIAKGFQAFDKYNQTPKKNTNQQFDQFTPNYGNSKPINYNFGGLDYTQPKYKPKRKTNRKQKPRKRKGMWEEHEDPYTKMGKNMMDGYDFK